MVNESGQRSRGVELSAEGGSQTLNRFYLLAHSSPVVGTQFEPLKLYRFLTSYIMSPRILQLLSQNTFSGYKLCYVDFVD
jgi:hypothetical protein